MDCCWSKLVLLIDKYIMNVSPSLIANDLMSSFSINATEMSAMVSLFLWAVVICQFFVAGPIIDKLGFRKVSFLTNTICDRSFIVCFSSRY